MPTCLKSIRRRIADIRRSPKFGFETRINNAITALETDYGSEGKDAARLLRGATNLARSVDDAAIKHLVPLRMYSRQVDGSATGMRRKLQDTRPSWRTVAFDVRPKPDQPGPDTHAPHLHPECVPKPNGVKALPYQLANAAVSEIAMDLAEAYDEDRKSTRFKSKSRSEELDEIISAFRNELADFAKISISEDLQKHRAIARAYRRFENVAEALAGEALVDKGIEAFKLLEEEEEEEEGVTLTSIEGVDGNTITASSVRQFIHALSKLPALGRWGRKKTPSEAVALARAIQGLGFEGITFTMNLHVFNAGRFQSAARATPSAIQDQLYKLLEKSFGRPVDFYFVMERGVDEDPHLHGAIALDPTPESLKEVRRCLKQLALAQEKRKAPERLVKVDPLTTPGRWGGYAVKASMVSSLRADVRNTICRTRGVANQAKIEWERMRREQRDAKKVLREVASSK